MDDAGKIFDYLPKSYGNPTEQEYITFLWDAFQTNYTAEKYPFAFLAYHMLFMCFVYFEIWQIRENQKDDFSKAMVGFNKDIEADLMKATTPFSLWQINESNVFRFLKLIGMDNADVGECTSLVRERNNAAHSNGNIFFRNQGDIDSKIEEVLRCIDKIQNHSPAIIQTCFEKFLLESADIENREFSDDTDQIREILVHGNYLSSKDIEIAKGYDVIKLAGNQNYSNIQSLGTMLQAMYPVEETESLGE
jgi:hypothetical protein